MVKEQKISIIHDIATRSPGLFLGMVIKFIKKGKGKIGSNQIERFISACSPSILNLQDISSLT